MVGKLLTFLIRRFYTLSYNLYFYGCFHKNCVEKHSGFIIILRYGQPHLEAAVVDPASPKIHCSLLESFNRIFYYVYVLFAQPKTNFFESFEKSGIDKKLDHVIHHFFVAIKSFQGLRCVQWLFNVEVDHLQGIPLLFCLFFCIDVRLVVHYLY